MFKGIDISKWQGNIDWQKVKNDGVEFVIIREGFGKKAPNQIDKKFKENLNGAKSVGISTGIYHYSYADSVNDAILEAQFCLENIAGNKLEFPICFDIEDSEMLALSNRQRTDICKAFCETIEKAGYYSMIYCNLDWYKNKLYGDELAKKYDIWLAHWNVAEPAMNCGIWQKSETGKIDGISGNVDLNIAYKNYPQIMRDKGINGFLKNQSAEVPKTPVITEKFITYIVKKGDTLWDLAKKYLGDGTKYSQIKKLNNLKTDTIYEGQVLKIKQ